MGVIKPPTGIAVTCYALAQRFIGIKELPGDKDHPFIMHLLTLDQAWPSHDEVPWCSAFAQYPPWLLRLPRSKDLRARSWLHVGRVVSLAEATVGFDVVIFNRGGNPAAVFEPDNPGPQPGHVGFYAGRDGDQIAVLGGNQGNAVSVRTYKVADLLGVRRLYP